MMKIDVIMFFFHATFFELLLFSAFHPTRPQFHANRRIELHISPSKKPWTLSELCRTLLQEDKMNRQPSNANRFISSSPSLSPSVSLSLWRSRKYSKLSKNRSTYRKKIQRSNTCGKIEENLLLLMLNAFPKTFFFCSKVLKLSTNQFLFSLMQKVGKITVLWNSIKGAFNTHINDLEAPLFSEAWSLHLSAF